MPPENKQFFSPDHHCTRTTIPSLSQSSPSKNNNKSSSLPTLFSVLASEPLRQHIAILTKEPSPPTIMHITTSAPMTDDHDDVTATAAAAVDECKDMATLESVASAALHKEEEVEEKVKEEGQDTSQDMSDVSSLTVESSAAIKQERERSVTMTPTTPPTTTVSAAAGSEGLSVKQEAKDRSSEYLVPIKTEPRPDPHSPSQSTDDEEGGADVSFMSEDQTLTSQRSELGEHLSADFFGNGLSLNDGSALVKIKMESSQTRSRSDQDMRVRSPSSSLLSPPPPSTAAGTGIASTQAAAAKYKCKTIRITKEVLIIELDDSDDDGGGGGVSGGAQVQTEGGEAENGGAEINIADHEDESTQVPSMPPQKTGPSATVLGKRAAKSPYSDGEDWNGEDFDDMRTVAGRLSKRPTISGSSETCPVELLDSDSENELICLDSTFAGSNGGSSSSAVARLSSGSSSGSGSGSGSGVSRRGPQAIVKSEVVESNARQEIQSLSQQIKAYQQEQRERFVKSQLETARQQTPVAAPPVLCQQSTAKAPLALTHQSATVRNSQAPEPYGTNLEPPPHYQYISDDDMEKELPPAYAVRGPRPLETDYPAHMTNDGFELTETQLHVLDLVVNKRQNVFFTGSAGTGKSVLLRELILRLRAKHSRWRQNNDEWDVLAAGHVAVTASTGIAACNIRGCTLHSFAGIGLGVDPFEKLCWKVQGNKNVANRWKSTAVLVIDEVSMISAELLDLIEQLARFVRNDKRPWGGIQVVLVGDFFQLPPVEKGKEPRFCFEADAWRSIDQCIQLKKVFRQRDHVFVDALNQLRVGILSPSTLKIFRSLSRPVPDEDGIKPTELFPLRKQVEGSNASMLVKLPGESHFYIAQDSGAMAAKMEHNCIAPTKLELKVNAQVMLLKNQSGGSSGLVNGSIGVVIEMTREAATNVRTSKDGKALPSLNTPGELLPKVRFKHDSGGYTDMVLGREEWTVEAPTTRRVRNNEEEFTTEILGRRVQIPLCLAWAMSIHKSQGQTLSKVKVDLGRVFEKGQAYVALSRATSLEGLQVTHFDVRKVMVHQKVVNFYEQIGGVPGS